MIPNNYWVTEEIKGEFKRYTESNENDNRKYQNLGDGAKAVIKEKFIALQAYHKKQEKSQTI